MSTQADADRIASDLKQSNDVEEVEVDLAQGRVTVVMKSTVEMERIPGAIAELRKHINEPLRVTGTSFEFSKQSSTKMVK